MTRHRKRRKLKADINVVPYIDVMLVLLIIFMVTAPLLNLGVDVDLPKSKAAMIDQKKDPVIAVITSDGHYMLKLAEGKMEPVTEDELTKKVGAFHEQNPDVAVYIAANGKLAYQQVMDLMVALQNVGIPHVALMSQPTHADTGTPGKR
jgi:biopolymer transport protein TolR